MVVCDEVLNDSLFAALLKARVELEERRRDYNTERPHSAPDKLRPIAYAARNVSVRQRAGARRFLASRPFARRT